MAHHPDHSSHCPCQNRTTGLAYWGMVAANIDLEKLLAASNLEQMKDEGLE